MPTHTKKAKPTTTKKQQKSFPETKNGFKPRLAVAIITKYAEIIFFKSFMSEFIKHNSPVNHNVTTQLSMFQTNKRRWFLIHE